MSNQFHVYTKENPVDIIESGIFSGRDKSITLYTDNATNFVEVKRKLKEQYDLFYSEQYKNKMQGVLTDAGVQWHFIPPPRFPHFSGLWGSAVTLMKHLIQKYQGCSSDI